MSHRHILRLIVRFSRHRHCWCSSLGHYYFRALILLYAIYCRLLLSEDIDFRHYYAITLLLLHISYCQRELPIIMRHILLITIVRPYDWSALFAIAFAAERLVIFAIISAAGVYANVRDRICHALSLLLLRHYHCHNNNVSRAWLVFFASALCCRDAVAMARAAPYTPAFITPQTARHETGISSPSYALTDH